MTEVASLADRLFVLNNGRLVMEGEPRSVFAQGQMLRAWGLAPPPLSELLALLRRGGMSLPGDISTLDEAFDALQHSRKTSGTSEKG
jgi:energy-coupling factor transport system ATP-binding protein